MSPEPPGVQRMPTVDFCPKDDDHCDHWYDCAPCCRCGFDGGGEDCDCPRHQEKRRLTDAIRVAASIFVSLGKDMGTFTRKFDYDEDERQMLGWLELWAPDLVPPQSAEDQGLPHE